MGSFGGGALQLQFLGPDGGTWVNQLTDPLTETGIANFSLPTGQIQAALADATSPSLQVTAAIVPTLVG